MNGEKWLPVLGYEGLYEVSDMGRVRSLDRVIFPKPSTLRPGHTIRFLKGRVLKFGFQKSGHRTVVLSRESIEITHWVHKLVMRAFVGPRPKGRQVCHRDGDGANNRLTNMYYGTPQQNYADSVRHGTAPRGSVCRSAILTESDVYELRYGDPTSPIEWWASKFGMSVRHLRNVRRGDHWVHVTP